MKKRKRYVVSLKLGNKTYAIKQAEDSVQNMLESIDMMESIIRLAAISDKHSLELQKWIKEYKLDVEQLDAQITEVATHE